MGIADVYDKGAELGTGTFGEVIKGTHKTTGDVVAIKKIRVGGKGEVRVAHEGTYTAAIAPLLPEVNAH